MDRRPGRVTPDLNTNRDWLAQAASDTGRRGPTPEVAVQRSIDALTKAMIGIGVELRKLNAEIAKLRKQNAEIASVDERLASIESAVKK